MLKKNEIKKKKMIPLSKGTGTLWKPKAPHETLIAMLASCNTTTIYFFFFDDFLRDFFFNFNLFDVEKSCRSFSFLRCFSFFALNIVTACSQLTQVKWYSFPFLSPFIAWGCIKNKKHIHVKNRYSVEPQTLTDSLFNKFY